MVKKSLIVGLTAIILSLCCGLCFAAEGNNGNSVNLGNEITSSVDKAGQSMKNLTDNVFSTNMVNEMRTDVGNMERSVTDGMNNVDDGIVNTRPNNGDNAGNYNTTRTTTEATNTGFNTMSTTTWMWIILAVAAIIVIAAIWYYATQNND